VFGEMESHDLSIANAAESPGPRFKRRGTTNYATSRLAISRIPLSVNRGNNSGE
jgi:hypothetical protein